MSVYISAFACMYAQESGLSFLGIAFDFEKELDLISQGFTMSPGGGCPYPEIGGWRTAEEYYRDNDDIYIRTGYYETHADLNGTHDIRSMFCFMVISDKWRGTNREIVQHVFDSHLKLLRESYGIETTMPESTDMTTTTECEKRWTINEQYDCTLILKRDDYYDPPHYSTFVFFSRIHPLEQITEAELDFELLENAIPDGYLQKLNSAQLRLFRNAIYARYGREFSDSALQRYFYSLCGFTENQQYSDDLLTVLDKENIQKIIAEEMTRK